MRLVEFSTDKNDAKTSRYHRSSNMSNRGFGASEYIDVRTAWCGQRSFRDDTGTRITGSRRCATIRKTLGLGD